jgi:hypothetical protein
VVRISCAVDDLATTRLISFPCKIKSAELAVVLIADELYFTKAQFPSYLLFHSKQDMAGHEHETVDYHVLLGME